MRVLNYIESTIWAMLPSAYDRMHNIVAKHSSDFDRLIENSLANQQVDKNFPTKPVEIADGEKFKVSADIQIRPEAMLSKPGVRLAGTRYVQIRENGIAVIDLNGVIAMRMNIFQELCEGGTSTEMLMRDFQFCLDSPDVQSIVFLINSPGGEAFGTHEFAQFVYASRGKKRTEAYVSGYCCSAALFIASACDKITVDAQAMIGSIGVVSEWQDWTEFYKMMGIDRRVYTSSNAPKKRLDMNKAEDEKEFIAILDGMENVFIKFVAKARNVSVETVKSDFGQGSVFIGKDAVNAKMVDAVGSLEGVIKSLARSGKKSGFSANAEDNSEINFSQEKHKKMGLKEKIMALFAEDEDSTPSLSSENNKESEETKPAAKSPELIAAEEKIAQLTEEKESGKAQSVAQAAEVFASAEIVAGRMLPTEKADFLADYAQAAADDEASPLAQGSRVERLKTRQSARKSNGLTQEKINASANKIVFGNKSEDSELDEEVASQVGEYVGANFKQESAAK